MRFEDIRKVIVLAGGPSSEAAVSRVTAAGMAEAVRGMGKDVDVWELEGDWLARLVAVPKEGVFVLLALHGCPGEDGTVQGVLELLGVPYQGSGVLGCALAMDKVRARTVMAAAGVEVAEALVGDDGWDNEVVSAFLAKHGKVVAKPVASGSSVGVSIVSSMAEWPAAYTKASAEGDVLVEQYIAGKELTVGVLVPQRGEPTALAVVEIVANKDVFYDYESKYGAGGSDHICPALLPEVVTAAAQQGAVKAALAVGAKGACRVDFRYDDTCNKLVGLEVNATPDYGLVVLEVNTLPGMTPTSLLPDAARFAATPMDYPALVRWMINDGLTRLEKV
ncbi:MAG: D-alanine--D-alanine ligase [Alphaproteobacteria bacterium]